MRIPKATPRPSASVMSLSSMRTVSRSSSSVHGNQLHWYGLVVYFFISTALAWHFHLQCMSQHFFSMNMAWCTWMYTWLKYMYHGKVKHDLNYKCKQWSRYNNLGITTIHIPLFPQSQVHKQSWSNKWWHSFTVWYIVKIETAFALKCFQSKTNTGTAFKPMHFHQKHCMLL